VQAVQEVPIEEVYKYGVVEYEDGSDIHEVKGAVEKPKPEDAPSNMAQYGRFVCSYDLIRMARETATGKGGELWVTDMIDQLITEGKKVLAPPVEGVWLTTGDPLEYLKTSMKFALQRENLKDELIAFLISELHNGNNQK
jgi:UTP--glucose-1-phosphate uridylyltransferase